MPSHITQLHQPDSAWLQTIRDGLSAANLAVVPELVSLPEAEFTVTLRNRDGRIIGGAYCEFDWGCLFVDTLWVDDAARGNGYGAHIMAAAESYAAQRGIGQAYLFTADFQARPFYEKFGYQAFATVDERPRGHHCTYLYKSLAPAMLPRLADAALTVDNPPNAEAMQRLELGLLGHALQHVPIENTRLAFSLTDDDGKTVGGIFGGIFWDWFDLRYLWVDEAWRKQGYGSQLLAAALAECRQREIIGVVCDTADFQAVGFYQKHGFITAGTLANRPPNHTSHFMTLRLV